MSTETFDYNTESCVWEAISKEMRRHQNAKCLNSGRILHLKREFLGIISPLGMARIGRLRIQVYVEGVAKAKIGSTNLDQ